MHPAPIHAASPAPIHIASTPVAPTPAPTYAASTPGTPPPADPKPVAPIHSVALSFSSAGNTVEERRFQRRVKHPQEVGALAPAKLA